MATKKSAVETKNALTKFFASAKGAGAKANRAATSRALREVETALGHALPAEVRAFYEHADGFGLKSSSFSVGDPKGVTYTFLSLKGMKSEWQVWKALEDSGEGGDPPERSAVDSRLKPKRWIDAWIPLATDDGGNSLMIDMAPSKKGTVGQIFRHWHDDDAREVVASGLNELFGSIHWSGEAQPDAQTAHEKEHAVKAWVFTLRELPGFCKKEVKIVKSLPDALLDLPCMIYFFGEDARYEETTDALYKALPEKVECRPADEKRMFSLIGKLRDMLAEECPHYLYEGVESGDEIGVQEGFHSDATKPKVVAAFTKLGVRVDDTRQVIMNDALFVAGRKNPLKWLALD